MGDRRPYGLQHLKDYSVQIRYSSTAINVPDRYIRNRYKSVHVLLAKPQSTTHGFTMPYLNSKPGHGNYSSRNNRKVAEPKSERRPAEDRERNPQAGTDSPGKKYRNSRYTVRNNNGRQGLSPVFRVSILLEI